MRPNAQAPRQLSDFAGLWRLERTIEDAKGPPGRLSGQSKWSRCEAGLLQVETGTLHIGMSQFAAERKYIWHADLTVWFEDGRFFHQVPRTGGLAEHWCDPDHYRVTYDFSDAPGFTTTWEVNGPRKDYRMTSHYSPA